MYLVKINKEEELYCAETWIIFMQFRYYAHVRIKVLFI